MSLSEAAFQFHCMICYEEFENSPERHPVVLPCGHTYICKTCGDRLDKCMECRRDLFLRITPEPTTPASPNRNAAPAVTSPLSRYGRTGRGGASGATTNRPPPPIKRRLPLPKNAVLLSLIESTRMISSSSSSDPQQQQQQSSQEEEDNLDQAASDQAINVALAAAVSTGKAGTYAVASRGELQIFPTRPVSDDDNDDVDQQTAKSGADEDVTTLVEFFQDQRVEKNRVENSNKDDSDAAPEDEMAALTWGDRIQVVSIDGGWAKLARAYGYVCCSNNEIVKVGNPIDRACILEAMLRSVSDKRQELRIQQSENDTQFIKLMNHLQGALQMEEDLTVVCRSVYQETDENEAMVGPKHDDSIPEDEASRTDSPTETRDQQNPSQAQSIPHEQSSCTDPMASTESNLSFRLEHPSTVRMPAGALAWRERPAGDGRASINFRTGMSGHKALLSNHSHPHDFLVPDRVGGDLATTPSDLSMVQTPGGGRKNGLLKMSTHSGLTMRSANKKPRGRR